MCSEVVFLDVFFEDGLGIGFLSIISNAKGAAALDLSGFTGFLILFGGLLVFALSGPFSEVHSAGNGDEWDFVLLGEGSDELLIFGIITVFSKNAKESIGSIEGFSDLVKSFNKA